MNFKAFVAFCILIACFCSNGSEAAQQKVQLIGNHRIKSDFITNIIKGRVISDVNLNQILKELYATQFFSDVRIVLDEDVVRIYVTENPIVSNILISGNRSVSYNKITELMKIKKYTIFNISQLDSDIKHIRYLYKTKGRPETKIEYILKKVDDEHVNLVLEIKESKIAKIKRIEFIGNKNFSDGILKQIIASREAALYRIFGSSYYFINERLDLDKEYLTRFYLANGYFNFRILSVDVKTVHSGAYITFVLDEGELQKFGSLKIKSAIGDVELNDKELLVDAKTGDVFSIDKVNSVINKIKSYFNSKNYYFINVMPEYQSEGGNVVGVTFNVVHSEKIYVGRINVSGNDNTVDSVIRRQILFSENDPFDILKLKMAKQNILNLGFFDEVDVRTDKLEGGDVDVDFYVKEKGTGLINIALNYRSDIGFALNFGVTESNLFGEANELSFAFKKAVNYLESSITYTKPHIFDSDIAGSISFFGEHQGIIGSMLFNSASVGTRLNLGFNITERLNGSLYYTYNYNNIYNVSPHASEIIKEQEGENIISLIGYAFSYNTLDSYIIPTSGYVVRGNQGFAGIGGNLYYVKSELSGNYFIPISRKNRVITQLISKMGYIFGYSGQKIKVGQRFFMYEMRGFEPSGVGPRDGTSNDSLGGNFYFFSSVQTEFPVGLPTELNINGSLFFDIGTVTGLDTVSTDTLDSHSLRASFGVGIVWKSPMGPLRIDFALPIVKESYDKTSYIRPSVGYFS